jgi:hypothetical protein
MCEYNSHQSQLQYFSMFDCFILTCFSSYTGSHHQAVKTPTKNYYVNHITLYCIIHTYIQLRYQLNKYHNRIPIVKPTR